GPGVGALEIGPGIGVLTTELAQRCDKVVAVELDQSLAPALEETLKDYSNVEIVWGDFLKLNLEELLSKFGDMPVIVCANLPYYITTPILMRLLESRLPLESITVLLQKETAQRICAELPSRQAGAITAAIAWYTKPELLFTVSKGSFLPPPKVDSAVVRLTLRKEPPVPVKDEAMLFRVMRGAFAQRRKTMLNGLSAALNLPKDQMAALLEQAQVDPGARAEQLDLAAFARISDRLSHLGL
ncbi:MAG TPA: ribosomal RNA small subunit methyltransferase A, partial [Clostridiales bacterium]|nr:ribosomal RNA small subunit methyltransferase A [Clostridiales bacterium]